jgi:bifunctional non-homologous end joining protein LigD
MGAKYTYETVRNFAHLLCIKINEQIPELTSLERSPKARKRKVYLDYLQNNRGQTLASVYSVRPKTEAPVSTPLKWAEVTKSLHPTQFTMKNIPQRVQKHGDLFRETMDKGVDIKKILKNFKMRRLKLGGQSK